MEVNGGQDADSEMLEEHLVVQESWVKELLKIDGVKGYYVTNGSISWFFLSEQEVW